MSNSRIIDVLDEIENNSRFYFLFKQKLVYVERRVDISVEEKTIDHILSELFNGTDVSYIVRDRQIVLTTYQPEESILTDQPQRVVTGKVTDSRNQPLPGVTVVIKGTTQGTITDADGTYTLQEISAGAVLQF